MSSSYTSIELITLLYKYKKEKNIKLPKINKLKKSELIKLCNDFNLLGDGKEGDEDNKDIKYTNLTKKQMIDDISIYFYKQNKTIENINKMKKEELQEIIYQFNIPHITKDILKYEIEEYNKCSKYINIIKYNFIKYDNIDIKEIDFNKLTSIELKEIIDNHKLIDNEELNDDKEHLFNFINDIINNYKTYCIKTNKTFDIKNKNIKHIFEVIYNNI